MANRAMAQRVIDYDRGVIIKTIASTGMDVFMYVDEPGVFLNVYGNSLPDDVAALAGYDVKVLGRERTKRLRMKEAFAQIEAEMDTGDSMEPEIIAERGGYKLQSIGLGRHNVLDENGNTLTPVSVPREVAELLFNKLAPEEKATRGKK